MNKGLAALLASIVFFLFPVHPSSADDGAEMYIDRAEEILHHSCSSLVEEASRDERQIETVVGLMVAVSLYNRDHGDLVVGNLTITDKRREIVDFSDPWLSDVDEYVVTPASSPDLASVDDLSGQTVHVRRHSSYWESIGALNERLKQEGRRPVTVIEADARLEDEDLLEMVNVDALPTIVVDSHKAKFWARVFDGIKLHPAASVRTGGRIAWAFRKESPQSLYERQADRAQLKPK